MPADHEAEDTDFVDGFLTRWASKSRTDITRCRESLDVAVAALDECLDDGLDPPLAIACVEAQVWRRAVNKSHVWAFVDAISRLRPAHAIDDRTLPPEILVANATEQFYCGLTFDFHDHHSLFTSSLNDACLWHPTQSALTFEAATAAISRLRAQGLSTSAAVHDVGTPRGRRLFRYPDGELRVDVSGDLLEDDDDDVFSSAGERRTIARLVLEDHDDVTEASRSPAWSLATHVDGRRHVALAEAWADPRRRSHQPWLLAALSSRAVVEACLDKDYPVPRGLFAAAFPPGAAGSQARVATAEAVIHDASRSVGDQQMPKKRSALTAIPTTPVAMKKRQPRKSQDEDRLKKAMAFARRIVAFEVKARGPPDPEWRRRLCEAVFQSRGADVAESLLMELGFPDLPSAPAMAAAHDSVSWLEQLRKSRDLDAGRPLTAASAKGAVNAVSYLLQNRVPADSPNDFRRTPLGAASQSGSVSAVQLLLNAGADVDKAAPGDPLGYAPLHLARTVDVAQVLLDAGADPRKPSLNGHSPYDILPAHISRYLKPQGGGGGSNQQQQQQRGQNNNHQQGSSSGSGPSTTTTATPSPTNDVASTVLTTDQSAKSTDDDPPNPRPIAIAGHSTTDLRTTD